MIFAMLRNVSESADNAVAIIGSAYLLRKTHGKGRHNLYYPTLLRVRLVAGGELGRGVASHGGAMCGRWVRVQDERDGRGGVGRTRRGARAVLIG